MTDGPKNGFGFIIDTDSYAGNFEREMTAYLTGQIGDCEVGEEMIEILPSHIKESFEINILQVADEHGCYRPTSCALEPSTGQNNSVIIFFYKMPSQEEIDFLKERVKSFDEAFKTKGRMAKFNINNPEIKILGFRMIEFKSTQDKISI